MEKRFSSASRASFNYALLNRENEQCNCQGKGAEAYFGLFGSNQWVGPMKPAHNGDMHCKSREDFGGQDPAPGKRKICACWTEAGATKARAIEASPAQDCAKDKKTLQGWWKSLGRIILYEYMVVSLCTVVPRLCMKQWRVVKVKALSRVVGT